MSAIVTKLGQAGRLVIPAKFRKALELQPGDELVVNLEEDGLHILSVGQWLKRAQAIVRRHVPEGKSLVDELLAERRMKADLD